MRGFGSYKPKLLLLCFNTGITIKNIYIKLIVCHDGRKKMVPTDKDHVFLVINFIGANNPECRD